MEFNSQSHLSDLAQVTRGKA